MRPPTALSTASLSVGTDAGGPPDPACLAHAAPTSRSRKRTIGRPQRFELPGLVTMVVWTRRRRGGFPPGARRSGSQSPCRSSGTGRDPPTASPGRLAGPSSSHPPVRRARSAPPDQERDDGLLLPFL